MTNPSAQTMLELREALRRVRAGSADAEADIVEMFRTASAPAAVRDRDAIARIINPDLFFEYDLLVKQGTLAKNGARWAEVVFGQKIAASHAKADAIIALATPEEASTAAEEAVAWRVKNYHGYWHATTDKALAETWRDIEKFDVQPLYAAPPAAQTDGEKSL